MKKTPLVSCVMPTYNRAAYVPKAINCFLAQTYENRELVILDDGSDNTAALIPSDLRIRYFILPSKYVLGTKRNMACDLAQGEIIAHWDSDDWYAAGRLEAQVKWLLASGKSVTGWHRFFYWDEIGRRAYEYHYTGAGFYANGNTQCYFKDWWRDNPFKSLAIGEDSEFSFVASKALQLTSAPAGGLMVARDHGKNTCKKALGSACFPPTDVKALPAEFFAA